MGNRILRALTGASLACITMATATSARAQGFDVQRFQPSERGSSWFVLESLDLRGKARPALGAVLDYQRSPLVLREKGGDVRSAIVSDVLTAHVGASFAFVDRLRASLSLPVVLYTTGEAGATVSPPSTYAAPKDSTTQGDARLAVDARLFGEHDGPLTMAVGARLWVPTGAPDSYSGDGTVRFSPHVLAAGNVSMFTYAARAGVLVRNPDAAQFSDVLGSELLYAAAAGARFADGRATVGPEVFGSTTMSEGAFRTRTSPLEALLGGHYAFPNGLRAGAGVGAGVVSGFGAPAVRVVGSLEWMPEIQHDADGDGIPDGEDACRDVAGVRSAEPSRNGCPAPPPEVDTDGDGIADRADACPDVRGEATNDPRTNGCIDRDADGIMDPLDRCPFEAGPKSDEPMKNGCPDKDKDKDGIEDAADACPDQPGPKSDDPEKNGCPNPDRDGDGIPNAEDACPDQPGKADPAPNKNGCPVAFVDGAQIRIREQVKFKTNSAQIQPGKDSLAVLDAILEVLKTHPEIKRVRVEGHTDNRGDAKKNFKLSQDRAAAVVAWLVEHGVEKGRLTSLGFGMDRPLDANDTEEGRQNNRRVELHIEESGAAPAK